MNPKVDILIEKQNKWKEEFQALRNIILECNLDEDIKWGTPCYAKNGKNIVLIHGFKEYCAILFFKGSLIKDDSNYLIQQSNNVQAGRQIRFTSLQQVVELQGIIKSYVLEAIQIEKQGLKVELKKTEDLNLPEEFQKALTEMPELKQAFDKLTPGRQRAYIIHFSEPKQAKTREARIEKHIDRILNNKGLYD